MPKVKMRIFLVDQQRIFPLRGEYDTDTRLATVKRGFRQYFPAKYQVAPEHLYQQHKGMKTTLVCFVDNASRRSIAVAKTKTREVIDGKTKNTLDYLIEEKFWKSLISRTKLPLSTVLITLCAGGGIFYLIRDILIPIFTGGGA